MSSMRRCILATVACMTLCHLFAKPIKSNLGGTKVKTINSIQQHTAKDYIQDDLVAMWDGIENAGWGVHDQNATMWKDLSINGYDLPIPTSMMFGDDYCYATSKIESAILRRPVQVYDSIVEGGGYTIECVFHADGVSSGTLVSVGNENTLGVFNGSRSSAHSSNKYNGIGSNQTILYSYDKNNKLKKSRCVRVELGVSTSIYENGIHSISSSKGGIAGLQYPQYVGLGINAQYLNSKDGAIGKYHSIRIYSRALSIDEIAHNYAIDKERFNIQ